MQDLYGIETNKDFISKVTDKILPEINAFRKRLLQKIYPNIFIDGIRFNVKEESSCVKKSLEKLLYLIIQDQLKNETRELWFTHHL